MVRKINLTKKGWWWCVCNRLCCSLKESLFDNVNSHLREVKVIITSQVLDYIDLILILTLLVEYYVWFLVHF